MHPKTPQGVNDTSAWEWMVQVLADGYASPVYCSDIVNEDNDDDNYDNNNDDDNDDDDDDDNNNNDLKQNKNNEINTSLSSFLCVGMVDSKTSNKITPLPKERGTICFVFPTLYGWESVKCLRE
eukprot:5519896-Ditylum_brightwellii.AAC.1